MLFDIAKFVDDFSQHEKDTTDPEDQIIDLVSAYQSLNQFLNKHKDEVVEFRALIGEKS
tara:strand:+ start:208 stop:384 length:177 start_codon:yes stop_codon:yes gene_type:complete